MKIGIVSDSHDRALALAGAVAAAQAAGAQAIVHCGDLIGANTLRPLFELGVPVHFVNGNNLGDRVEALRRREDPALRLRPLRQRDHQRRVRALRRSGRSHRRQAAAPVRRQGGDERRVHPVRRVARRKPPAPLLADLLHGLAEADAVRARSLGRGGQVDRLLHRHPRHRPARGLLPDGAERLDGVVRQVQAGAHRAGRGDRQPGDPRRGHRGLPSLRHRPRPGRAGDRHGAGEQRHCAAGGHRPRLQRVHRGAGDGGQFGAGASSSPLDVNRSVQSATAAALRAIQVVHKAAGMEAAQS